MSAPVNKKVLGDHATIQQANKHLYRKWEIEIKLFKWILGLQ